MRLRFKPTKKPSLILPMLPRRRINTQIAETGKKNITEELPRKRMATEEHSPHRFQYCANNFRRQIERNINLLHKKKDSQQGKKVPKGRESRRRYETETPEKEQIFRLLNSIITKKSDKCLTEACEEPPNGLRVLKMENISEFLKSRPKANPIRIDNFRLNEKSKDKDAFKSDRPATKPYRSQNTQIQVLKNQQNYSQWRRLSIEKLKRPKYEESSYDLESDRIEKYRTKNEQTLKKYFQSRMYLNRLLEMSAK